MPTDERRATGNGAPPQVSPSNDSADNKPRSRTCTSAPLGFELIGAAACRGFVELLTVVPDRRLCLACLSTPRRRIILVADDLDDRGGPSLFHPPTIARALVAASYTVIGRTALSESVARRALRRALAGDTVVVVETGNPAPWLELARRYTRGVTEATA